MREQGFERKYENTREELFEQMRSGRIKTYRMKTIISGDMLECELYPVFKGGRYRGKSKPRGETSEVQKELNRKNLVKRVIRLLNANFTDKDIWITLGYRKGKVPKSMEEVRRHTVNYIRRLQRYADKKGWGKIKYVYVIEYAEDKQIHIHIVINFPDRDVAEQKWDGGQYPQARRLQPDEDFGLEGMARYISKDPKGQKSYGYSLNLYKSWHYATVADGKLSAAHVAKIAEYRLDAQLVFEGLYDGYDYKDIGTYYGDNDFMSGFYIYVRMRKKQDLQSTAKGGTAVKKRRDST